MPNSTRLGLLAYSTNTGLGVQTWEFAQHLSPDKVLLVDLSAYNHMELHPERFADSEVVACHGFPTLETIDAFLDDLDVVFVAETPLNYALFSRARERGVRTILQPNHEFNDYHNRPDLPRPDLFALPSPWHYDDCPESKVLLHVPVATERLPQHPGGRFRRLLHIAGRPAVHDRNGTEQVIAAFKQLRRDASLTIRVQEASDQFAAWVDGDDRIIIDTEDVANYWDAYSGYDCLIMPRRYGGLCLPMQEALGCGIPVIMPDISPNDTALPAEWLVPASHSGTFQTRSTIDIYTADVQALTDVMRRFYDMTVDQARTVQNQARILGDALSWDNLESTYRSVINARP